MAITSALARSWTKVAKIVSKSRSGAGVQNMELEPEGAGRSLHVARGGLRKRRIGRINKQRHDGRCRHQLVQEPQPLRRKFAAQGGRARHVAAWAVEAGN